MWTPTDRSELRRLASLANSSKVAAFLESTAGPLPAVPPAAAAAAAVAAVPPQLPPAAASASPPPASLGLEWTSIQTVACDFGGYSGAKVTVYIDEGLVGVGAIPRESVTCDFTTDSFDLKVCGLRGKNFRLIKLNLEKDIDPAACRLKVKKDKVILKLAKVKGEFGSFESWTRLTSKKTREEKKAKAKKKTKDPQSSIMDMMQVRTFNRSFASLVLRAFDRRSHLFSLSLSLPFSLSL